MKLFIQSLGGSSSGVTVPTQVQRFRYGMDYAISSNSDNWVSNNEKVEFLSWKYGVRSTSYEAMSTSTVERDQYKQGIFECSIYWLSNVYSDPTSRAIPDYTDSLYSSDGAAVFNVTDGEAKNQRYPNIGTQLYYITNGRLGVKLNRDFNSWDMGQDETNGVSDPFDPTNVTNPNLFIESVGSEGDGFGDTVAKNINTSPQRHKCYSYSLGQEGTWQLRANYFLSGRNSSAGGNATGEYYDDWDIQGRHQISHPSSIRIADSVSMVGDTATKLAWVRDKIENITIPNKGWFNNFNHWWSTDMQLQEDFYAELQSIANGTNCWFAGMSEASEYRWFLDMVTSTKAEIIGGNCYVKVNINNKYNLPINHIVTPISVEVDLSGTSLSGKNIKSNKGGILSLGNDKYLVEVFATDLVTELSEGVQTYLDLSNPTVTNFALNGDVLTIDTNQETVLTLFSDEEGTAVARTYNYNTQDSFSGISSGTYYLGVMNNTNRTIIQQITV